jgi:DNA-binding MarR family transcriptional regulator
MDSSVSEKLLQQFHYFTNLIHRGHHIPHSRPAESDIGRGQGFVLLALMRKDGQTQTELASQLRIRPASLGELVAKLERGGYIERRVNENDKRIFNVYFTEKGQQFANNFVGERQENIDSLFSDLTESEQIQLSDLMAKLITSMEKRYAGNADDFDDWGNRGGPPRMGMWRR